MPRPAYLSTEEAHKALDRYVFSRDARCSGHVPKNVNPVDLPEYLEDTIIADLKGGACWRVFDVMDDYVRGGELGLMAPFLNKKEREDDEFVRSVCYTFAHAVLGGAHEETLGQDYYDYLLAHREARRYFEGLVSIYGVLLIHRKATSPETKIREEMKRIEPRAEKDDEADTELSDLDELTESILELEEDIESIKSIDSNRRPELRYRALAKNYVGLDSDLGPAGEKWVERTLRREGARSGGQIVAAFREVIVAPTFKGEDAADTDTMRVRALRAIDFFGGELDEKELGAIRPKGPADTEPLSWI